MDAAVPANQTQSESRRPSEGMSPELLKLGNNLVSKFHVMMRVSQIYDSNNVTFRQFTQESLQTINALIDKQGTLSLKMLKDDLFLNEERLRYSVDGFNSFKFLMTQWKKKLVGGVTFTGRLDEKSLKAFIYAMVSLPDGKEENSAKINENLTNQGIRTIEVSPLTDVDDDNAAEEEDRKDTAKKVFFETLGTIKEVIHQIKTKQYPDVRRLKRLAQTAVNLVMEDESILLGLTTIKNYDEYTFNHSVNVCIYSLAIGRRLGFSKKSLTELGITALLHDIGKSKIPIDTLNKPGKLDDSEWSVMKKHPLMGVEIVLNLKQLGEINPKMVIGIFDHHLKNDLSGYPRLFRKREVGLFGRIIQIADVYDAMTSPRVYRKQTYTPEQALAIMLKDKGACYDPILLKLFIGLVGVFPIGSLVLLNTKEVGIVYKLNPDPRFLDRPQVILVERGGKGEVKKELVDLMEANGSGGFKRSIVKTLDPNKYHVDIAKYFI